MRTRNSLERLAAAGLPLHAQAEALIGAGDEDVILERIIATDRPTSRFARRRPLMLALVAVVVLAAVAVVAALATGNGYRSSIGPAGHHHPLALSGAKIEIAGYHFRTPAGFTASNTACAPGETNSESTRFRNGFSAAASADGGCVEAAYVITGNDAIPTPGLAEVAPVAVGNLGGYYVPGDSPGESTLYVALPKPASPYVANPVYLVLFAQGLTEDQLIAVAQSGLPGSS